MAGVIAVLERAKQVAIDYYRLTGKPLGITGEVGEYEAKRLLELTLAPPRTPGYDATDEFDIRYQIKSRSFSALCLFLNSKKIGHQVWPQSPKSRTRKDVA